MIAGSCSSAEGESLEDVMEDPGASKDGPATRRGAGDTVKSSGTTNASITAQRLAPSLISRLSAQSAGSATISSGKGSSSLSTSFTSAASITTGADDFGSSRPSGSRDTVDDAASIASTSTKKHKGRKPSASPLRPQHQGSSEANTPSDVRSLRSEAYGEEYDPASFLSSNDAIAGPSSWLRNGKDGSGSIRSDQGTSQGEALDLAESSQGEDKEEGEATDGEDDQEVDDTVLAEMSTSTAGAMDLLKSVSAKSAECRNETIKARSLSRSRSDKGKGKATQLEDLFAEAEPEPAKESALESSVERSYFVFTTAGKPVYVSQKITVPFDPSLFPKRRKGSLLPVNSDTGQTNEEDEEESATTRIGVMTALISIYADQGDRLREINSPAGRITFLQRTPLLLAAITKSKRREPAFVIRAHLDLLHNQILGLLSTSQLHAMFKRKASVDLRRLLEGTDPIIDALLHRLQLDRSLLMGALQPCRISVDLREELSQLLNPSALAESQRPSDLLYAILLFGSEIVTLLRPRKHSAHPVDMQLLINTVQGTSTLREAGSESWLPLSLPKFAPQGFVHVYSSVHEIQAAFEEGEPVGEMSTKLTLCFVTGNKDAFSLLSQWRSDFFDRISKEPIAQKLSKELGAARYTAEHVGVTGLRHFIYKSRLHTQVTSPALDTTYTPGSKDFHRLMGLYDEAYQAIHGIGSSAIPSSYEGELGKTLSPLPLKLHYLKTFNEAVLAWITQPFELYLVISPWLPKAAVISAANAVAKWVKKNETSLFLLSPPVF